MNGYTALARWYDLLNDGVDYEAWADALSRYFPAGGTLLDLACGTGNMTLPLAARGFDMIGVDLSCDMLALARDKAGAAGKNILFLQQSMTALDLYGTVDGIVCCLDGINYLTGEDDLRACFFSAWEFLCPGGRFVFDVNTPYKFEHIYGDRDYVLEDEGVLLAWRNEYEDGLCTFVLDLFVEGEDGRYERQCEEQTERCYTRDTLTRIAEECGFTVEGVYASPEGAPAADTDERWHFVLRKNKEQTNG